MTLAEHRRGGDIARLGLFDGQPHRPLVDDVAEAPMAVDDGRRRRFLDDDPGRAGHDMADLDALDIGRDLNDAVRIMADQVGADDMVHDQRRLVFGRAGGDEQRAADLFKAFGGYFWHVLLLPSRSGARLTGLFHHRGTEVTEDFSTVIASEAKQSPA